MLLKRDTYPDYIECIYESSNVLASKYKPNEKKLGVIFKSGRQYVYENVSALDYNKFESAKSQGAIIKEVLKNKPYTHATTIDTTFFENNIRYLKLARK